MSHANRRATALLAVCVTCFDRIKERYAPSSPVSKVADNGSSFTKIVLRGWESDESDYNAKTLKDVTNLIRAWEKDLLQSDWYQTDKELSPWVFAAIAGNITSDLMDIYDNKKTGIKFKGVYAINMSVQKIQNIIDRRGSKFSELDKANEAVYKLYELLKEV